MHSALGGILGNLKSGRGLFGAEATTSFSKTVLNTVEQQIAQIAEVGQEIRSSESAQSIKNSDLASPIAVKPVYSSADRWDVTITSSSSPPIEVTVRPTQKTSLLIQVWAKENGVNQDDYDLVIPPGTSWTSGIVDPDAPIPAPGAFSGCKVSIVKKS